MVDGGADGFADEGNEKPAPTPSVSVETMGCRYKTFLIGHIIHPEGFPPGRSIQTMPSRVSYSFPVERPSTGLGIISLGCC